MELVSHRENSEPLDAFEKRRETQRKGVSRIPEEERIRILRENGVTEESIHEEARNLDMLNYYRLQSIASPTENPLPESQREMYRRAIS